jgi:hypothetical protein
MQACILRFYSFIITKTLFSTVLVAGKKFVHPSADKVLTDESMATKVFPPMLDAEKDRAPA